MAASGERVEQLSLRALLRTIVAAECAECAVVAARGGVGPDPGP